MEIDLKTRLETGERKLNNGEYEGAIVEYTEAIKLAPHTYPQAFLGRGKAKISLLKNVGWLKFDDPIIGLVDLEGVIKDFETCIDYNKRYESTPYFDKTPYYNARITADAQAGLAEAYFARANKKINERDFDGASNDFSMAIEYKPDYADAYFFRAMVEIELDSDIKAGADFNIAIKINPNDGRYYFSRGELHYKYRNYYSKSLPDAYDDFQKAAELGVPEAEAKLKEHYQEFLPFLR